MSWHVLVVEDNEDIATVVETTLKLRDFHVGRAANGQAGIRKAQEGHYDLIILDVLMPGMDGFQVLDHLKQDGRTSGIPVALFTADLSDRDRRQALAAGAAGVLHKPFDPTVFLTEVQALVQGNTP